MKPQPGIILPIESMCEIHKELFKLETEEAKKLRVRDVGMKVLVSPSKGSVVSTNASRYIIDMGNCIKVRVYWPDGTWTNHFSCEVSTD